MPFRSDQEALRRRVDKLNDDVRERDAQIAELRRKRSGGLDERSWRRIIAVLAGAIVVLLPLATWLHLRPAAARSMHPVARWATAHTPAAFAAPLLVDIDGDGTEDFIGRFEGREPRAMYLGAFDGATRHARWRIGPLDASGPGHLAVSAKRLVATDGATARVHSLLDGSVLLEVALPGKALAMCAPPLRGAERRGEVWIMVAGDEHRMLDPHTGALRAGSRPAWCGTERVVAAPDIEGYDAQLALVDGDAMVALAHRDGQAAFVGFERGAARTRWTRRLGRAGRAPRPGEQAILHDGVLFGAYRHDPTGETRLVALDAASGHVRWQTVAPHDAREPARAMVAGTRHLYLVHGPWLSIFDIRTGERVDTLGEPGER